VIHDLPSIVAIAAGCSIAVAAVGFGVARLVRRGPIGAWLGVVVAVTVASVAAGVTGTAQAMFVSDHDLRVALIVVAVSAVVAGLTAAVVVRPVLATAAQLREAARHVGEPGYVPVRRPATAQFAGLAAELTETHRRLLEARERERMVERSRRELVAWVSHDLRTPLAGLRAMAEALEDGIVDEPAEVAGYHTRMRLDVDNLAGMVDDLFELSRVHAGALSLSLSRVPLADLVSDAVAAADPLARAKGVLLRGGPEIHSGRPVPDRAVQVGAVVAARPGDRPDGAAGPDTGAGWEGADRPDGVGYAARSRPVEVEVDVGEVGRVLSNLLVNAIRHTPGDGTVEVVAGARDGRAWVSVRDACGGIPADDLERIFDVGYRGEAARTPRDGRIGSGAGLGLAIARGIVEAHAGAIAVDNTDAGCCFVVTFPTPV
jgi:signal transduction histidine kinase